MRHKDPELMKKINIFVEEFYIRRDRTPSMTEIANEFGFARSTAQKYLKAMDREGMLSYKNGILRTAQMPKLKTERAEAPLVGSIPCGELSYEEENVECVTTLPKAIFGEGPFYILHAFGDSMVDEGIDSGDLVVIRRDAEPQVGDLVVALDSEGQNTLKKYGGIDPTSRMAMLLYCNRAVYGKKILFVKDLVSQGVVSHIIKSR